MSVEETYETVARAHAVHKMYLQAIGTLVVRQLVKDGTINIEKLQDAAMDLHLIDQDASGKFIALPISNK